VTGEFVPRFVQQTHPALVTSPDGAWLWTMYSIRLTALARFHGHGSVRAARERTPILSWCRIVSGLTPAVLAKAPERRVFERMLCTIRSINPGTHSRVEGVCSPSEGIQKFLFSYSLEVGALVKIGISLPHLLDSLRARAMAVLAPFMIHELFPSLTFTAVTRVQIPSRGRPGTRCSIHRFQPKTNPK